MDPPVGLQPGGVHKGGVAVLAGVCLNPKVGLEVTAQRILLAEHLVTLGTGVLPPQFARLVSLLVAKQRLSQNKAFAAMFAPEATTGAGRRPVAETVALQLILGQGYVPASLTGRVPAGVGVGLPDSEA